MEWHALQSCEVLGCSRGLPVAVVPLWQLAQVPITSLWLTVRAGAQAVVRWQSSHKLLVAMWVAFLPGALVPLWHDAQLALMPLWLNVAGVHAVVPWQLPQSAVVAMWVAGLPLALLPL